LHFKPSYEIITHHFSNTNCFFAFILRTKKSDKTFEVFNEGVTLNLKSIQEQNKGNLEKAAFLNKQSIDQFKETLKLDSMHSSVRSALGHSFYVD
jgi:hypothetical protein